MRIPLFFRIDMHMLRWLVPARKARTWKMTFYPSSELLLDPSPFRVSDSVPGQLARSTARELALQRSRAPRPFATRGASPGLTGFALSVANEAWNLLLQQDIPTPDQEYPVDAPAGVLYRLRGSITYQRIDVPPFDVIQTVTSDRLFGGAILSVGSLRRVSVFAGGFIQTFEGLGVNQAIPGQPPGIVLDGGRNVELWKVLQVNSLSLTREDSPLVLILSTFPTTTQPRDGDTPDNDQAFPITLPGGIPGLLMPTPIIILIPRPADLGRRPVPVLFPPSIPEDRRRELPQMWLTPEGIQVGTGGQNDPVRITPTDTITNITNITQIQDFRQRIPPTVTTCTPDPEPPADCCDCEEIREIVIEELDSKFPPKRPITNQTLSFGAAESNTFVLPQFTDYVELQINTKPPNVRTQTGGDDAPEVSYNGWYSFGATSEASERIPLHYDSVSIPVPAGASAFSYTIYQGGTASVTVGYRVGA